MACSSEVGTGFGGGPGCSPAVLLVTHTVSFLCATVSFFKRQNKKSIPWVIMKGFFFFLIVFDRVFSCSPG